MTVGAFTRRAAKRVGALPRPVAVLRKMPLDDYGIALGMAIIAIGAFLMSPSLGLAVAGIFLIITSYLLGGD